ncbi:MAG: hypothetical protein OEZ01_16165 [Candidatus Heimdallarchaeota archaeon]|nr:hypothetical protein [Candidatus Heimdallarchaeota archaeon]MDH5647546.1 hypothetical protein [Candidatus Heimdallarchaeota archaeon]
MKKELVRSSELSIDDLSIQTVDIEKVSDLGSYTVPRVEEIDVKQMDLEDIENTVSHYGSPKKEEVQDNYTYFFSSMGKIIKINDLEE